MTDTLRSSDERPTPGEHGHPTTAHRDACPVCNPDKTVPQLNEAFRSSNELTDALSYEGQKDAWLDDLLTYLHFDPITKSHPDWVARAQEAEARLARLLSHKWDVTGERCTVCGDKDWMGGLCKGPADTGNKQDAHETNGQQIAAYELLAAALAELPDPDFVPEEEREDRLRRLRERIDAHLAVTDYMALRDADALPTYIHVGNVFRTDEEGDVLVDWDSEAYEPKVGTLLFVRLWTQAEIDTARKAGAVKANEGSS